jgi:CRP-like cAMP-binding protein
MNYNQGSQAQRHFEPSIIAKKFTLVGLRKGDIVQESWRDVDCAYSFVEGVCCQTSQYRGLNVMSAIAGPGEMTGTAMVLGRGVAQSLDVMLTDGRAFAVPKTQLQSCMSGDSVFSAAVLRLCDDRMAQLTETISFLHAATITLRLARLIVMIADRAGSHQIAMSHDRWAELLGVRRPSVTTSFHVLEGEGVVRVLRKLVVVVDRAALGALVANRSLKQS